ncbi:NUDIX hydrolase [Paenibacillus sp. MABNS29]|uniref:NUDIX hydrolase n=1 Tax=Paenibacillus sp. MABNS29 TaxID=3142627 RepID=UPI003D28563D
MLAKLVNKIPRDWLVFMYKHTPFTRLKNALVYRAQHKFLIAVLGIFTNDAGEVLLLKHVYRKQPWGIPGGWMELEQPEIALQREVREETGLEVEITSLATSPVWSDAEPCGSHFHRPGYPGYFPTKRRNLRHLLLPCRGMAGRLASTPEKAYSEAVTVGFIQYSCSFQDRKNRIYRRFKNALMRSKAISN